MLKWCIQKWDENKDKLREVINDRVVSGKDFDYDTLAELVASHIFVSKSSPCKLLMTTGLRSAYTGAACFIFGRNGDNSEPADILISKVFYGSCPYCDAIQDAMDNVDDLMTIAKDIVTSTIRPFNSGWDHDPRFDEIVYEKSEEEANGGFL